MAIDYNTIIYNKTEIDAIELAETTRVDAALDTKAASSDIGSPSGIASLDPDGKVDLIELPIASLIESEDDTNSTTLITPERLQYQIATKAVSADTIGAANGIAPLGADSLVPAINLPAIPTHQTFIVSTLQDMYDLPLTNTVSAGDRAIVTAEPTDVGGNLNGEYVAEIDTPAAGNWAKLPNLSLVSSVNGATGDVVITTITESAANAVDIAALDVRVGTSEADITALEAVDTAIDGRVTVNEADIVSLQADPTIVQMVPQAVAPVYAEAQFYYNDAKGTFSAQGPYDGIEVSIGHGSHVHVINNSGSTITAGMAVRPAGVAGGILQVTPALADTFENARVIGVAIIDIPNGASSAIATTGILTDLNTNGLQAGVPMYLSDTVAGTYTHIAPDIRTVVGGVFVADALVGVLRLDITTNQNVPTVYGGMQGQAVPTYAVTGVTQDIDGYLTEESVVVGTNLTTGEITLPNDGKYRVNFTANISFASSSSTRTVSLELYDATGAIIHYTYDKNIPRDATVDSLSFTYPIDEIAGNVHKIRIYSSVAMDVTFDSVVFDIESISIK